MDKSPNIAVLGAGVVGLTLATHVQDKLRGGNITVISEGFNEATVSSVAAGLFTPRPSFKAKDEVTTKKWVKNSWDYWQEILNSAESTKAGVCELSTYMFSKTFPSVVRNPMLEGLVPIYRTATADELKMCGGGWKYGSFYTAMVINCQYYLPWAENKFKSGGGKIMKRKIDSFNQIGGYDLIFNCTGLGAKFLCNDYDLIPLRGQIIKVKAPWIKTAFFGDLDTYVIPSVDGTVTLGGTRQYDSYNINVCKHDAAAILERCSELVPSLKRAEVIAHKVGLRPHRTPVRVEGEVTEGRKVVHCYGHGGYGVTCAPGTAADAVQIGLDMLRGNARQSKL